MANIVFEQFPNIYAFMGACNSRPNNHFFGGGSTTNSEKFSGTASYEEAERLLSNGMPEKASDLKRCVNRFKARVNVDSTRQRTTRDYCGYRPNVAAYLAGQPKSMYRKTKVEHKVKAISIVYDCTMNGSTSAETLGKAGETLLSMVYFLEMSGYRVNLYISPFASKSGSNRAVSTITLKEWKQPLDMLKLSFPLCNPSMFRRFGWRWAETSPNVKTNFPNYGSHMNKEEFMMVFEQNRISIKTTYVVNVDDCVKVDFDAVKLAGMVGIAL